MTITGRLVLIGLSWLVWGLPGSSVFGTASPRTNRALNRYVDFANECTHLLWEVQGQLETLNRSANRYQENPAVLPAFDLQAQVAGFTLLRTLQGICVVSAGNRSPLVDLQRLYEDTRIEEVYIPAGTRQRLNQQRDELWYTTIELLGLVDTLTRYVDQAGFRRDPGLGTLYTHLLHGQQLYARYRTHADAIRQLTREAGGLPPEGLTDLHGLLAHSRAVIRAVRAREPVQIREAQQALADAIRLAENRRSQRIPQIGMLGLPLEQGEVAYKDMLEYAQEIWGAVERYLAGEAQEPAYDAYSSSYFLYNQRLLTLFNHYRYGMAGYYNRLQRFVPNTLLAEVEEVPWLEIVLPVAVSPPPVLDTPLVPVQEAASLETSPTNHLIFLLDVSASMKKPDKLPVLKEGLVELLEQLRPEDRISIVVYSGGAQTVLEATSALYRDQIIDAVNRLASNGKTRLDRGIKEAYRLAETYYIPGGNNRILLASDGAFDLAARLRRLVARKAESGIRLSVLLLSRAEVPRTASQLRTLADTGQGNYYHVLPENVRRTLLTEAQAVFR